MIKELRRLFVQILISLAVSATPKGDIHTFVALRILIDATGRDYRGERK